jgi:hypothetical protein
MRGKTRYPRRKMTRAKDNNNATILSIGISKGRIAYQKLIGSRHVKATVPTATSHWANSQTCCMQDERLCLPLIPSFDVPFEHKKLICSFDFNSQLPQQKVSSYKLGNPRGALYMFQSATKRTQVRIHCLRRF